MFFVLQACPFVIDVYTEDCDDAEFKVDAIEDMMDKLQRPLCQSVMEKVKEKQLVYIPFIFSFMSNIGKVHGSWQIVRLSLFNMHFLLPTKSGF